MSNSSDSKPKYPGVPVTVNGNDGGAILVGTPDDEMLNVTGGVKVDSVGGRINVQLRDAAKSILPIP